MLRSKIGNSRKGEKRLVAYLETSLRAGSFAALIKRKQARESRAEKR
jgi:hypothetical protein